MDRFTRNYSIFMAVAFSIIIGLVLYEDPTVSELNDLLEESSQVSNYPYSFRVLRIENNIAVMNTPRSASFPVYKALTLLFPHLANRPQDDPDVMTAQQEMAKVQKQARAIVVDSGRIAGVRWELDKAWLSQHGIPTPSW